MKHSSITILFFCVSLTATASAQEAAAPDHSRDAVIRGSGTANFIPEFLGKHRLGNSGIFQSPDGKVGIGTTTPGQSGFSEDVLEVQSTSNGQEPNNPPSAIFGIATSTSANTAGVRGYATASTGDTSGVLGITFSENGWGVFGDHTNPVGGGAGVLGVCESTSNTCFGVLAAATGSTGFGVGVLGTTNSPDGVSALFQNPTFGNLITGQVGPGNSPTSVFRVDGTGKVFADGGFQPSGADFAESMAVRGDRNQYAAGDLLVIDPTANRRMTLALQPYSTLVAGIYSTKPGMLGTTRKVDEAAPQNEIPLAVVGIVPCKVTAENGSIQIGDLLVTSSTAGHAMKGTDRSRMLGAVVGKALEPLSEGKGVIQVLVTLQ